MTERELKIAIAQHKAAHALCLADGYRAEWRERRIAELTARLEGVE